MIDWSMLGIDATTELSIIKRAYAKKIKEYHPEDDPQGFQRLRQAYEAALKWAEWAAYEDNNKIEIYYEENEDDSENEDYFSSSMPQSIYQIDINEIVKEAEALYSDQTKRNCEAEWQSFLDNERLWHLDVKQELSKRMLAFLYDNHEMPFNSLIALNDFFEWKENPIQLIEQFFDWRTIVQKTKESNDLALKIRVAVRLLDKGTVLREEGRTTQAIAVYCEIEFLFKEVNDKEIQFLIAKALYNKGLCNVKEQRFEEALDLFNDLIGRFSSDDSKQMRCIIAETLYNKGYCLQGLERFESAIAMYDEAINCFEAFGQLNKAIEVVVTLYNKSYCLVKLDRTEEVEDIFNILYSRFGDSRNMKVKEYIAKLLYNQGISFQKLKRKEESILAYKRLISIYEGIINSEINGYIQTARRQIEKQSQSFLKRIVFPFMIITTVGLIVITICSYINMVSIS